MDIRYLLAAVLGVSLGLLLLIAPGAVVTVHTAGRLPDDRRGEYGTDGGGGRYWLVRSAGLAVALGGLYFGWRFLAA